MVTNNPRNQEILSWISEENHFKELILTSSGNLFINPERTIEAEEYWFYYKPAVYLEGELYTNTNCEFRSLGKALTSDLDVKLMKNKTEIGLFCDGVQIFSKRAGIPVGSTLIVLFRYRHKMVLIVAGDAFNRRSRTVIVDESETNDSFFFDEFTLILRQYDPKVAAQLAASREIRSVACTTFNLVQ